MSKKETLELNSPKTPEFNKITTYELPKGEECMVYCLTDLKKIREKLLKLQKDEIIDEETKEDISDLTRLAEASLMQIYENLKERKTKSYAELKEIVEVELKK